MHSKCDSPVRMFSGIMSHGKVEISLTKSTALQDNEKEIVEPIGLSEFPNQIDIKPLEYFAEKQQKEDKILLGNRR